MVVSVKLYAWLQQKGGAVVSVSLNEPSAVADLLREMGLAQHDVCVIAVNGVLGQHDTPLHNGDKVSLIPFICGG
jgi:molybdopterin converting factor small subunit